MKKQNEQLNQNISRLLKGSAGFDNPSQDTQDEFADKLITQALGALEQAKSKDKIMNDNTNNIKPKPNKGYSKFLRFSAIAVTSMAAMIVIAYIYMPTLNKSRKEFRGGTTLQFADDSQLPEQYKLIVGANAEKLGLSDAERVEYNREMPKMEQDAVVSMDMKMPAASPAINQPQQTGREKGNVLTESFEAKSAAVVLGDLSYSDARLGLPVCPVPPICPPVVGGSPVNGEPVDAMFFKNYGVNPFVDTDDDNLSTFASDVDTASFLMAKRYLFEQNALPPQEAIRVEEFVNYFNYGYASPKEEDFAIYAETAKWDFAGAGRNNTLLKVAVKAKEVSDAERTPAVLTFVIDVSGSMNRENRLGLVKQSLRFLVDRLKSEDMIGIAVYGSRGRVVLEHTSIEYGRERIINAIDQLRPEGSTNAEEGIKIGYEMADKAFRKGWINRVVLCSDGVANVGQTGPDQILSQIKSKVDKGIYLSSLGFGMGNYNDVLLEQLGNKGNGYYAYIDNFEQARKLFGSLSTALQVVGRDVKFQVEFNPVVVRSYRLIGYENRDLADKDFRNDAKDGGEINAGHSTTALYELKLWDADKAKAAPEDKAFTVYVRYKDPISNAVTEINQSTPTNKLNAKTQMSNEFALAASAAEMAEILRGSYWAKEADLAAVVQRIEKLQNDELTKLAKQAKTLLDPSDSATPDKTPDTPLTKEQIEEKLKTLKDLYEKGLISKEVYEQKQLELLNLLAH